MRAKCLTGLGRTCSAIRSAALAEVERIGYETRGERSVRIVLPAAPQVPAIVEPLEPRVHLTNTFHCYMSATVVSRTVSVVLWTTGGKASQYVVHWNDTNSGGSSSITYTAPADGTPLTESYTYHGTGSYTPAAVTAVATLSGSTTTATAYYALNKTFGNFQGTGSGAATDIPNGDTGSVGQTSLAIDTNSFDHFYKEAFVASSYYPSGGGGPLFAVTAFSNGQPDPSWGVYNGAANDGTFVVPSFGGGSDVPLAMAFDPSGPYLIVVGKCAGGWAIAVVDTGTNVGSSGNYGNVVKTTGSGFETGQANAVWVDQTDSGGHFVAVGTDGSHMVAAGETTASLSPYSSWPTPKGIRTLSYVSGISTTPSNS